MSKIASEVEGIDALTCPICLNEYKDPLIIQCHHSFCHTCLDQWICHNNVANIQFKCPVCKQENEMPRNGVSGFQKSFVVAQFRDLLLQTGVYPSYPMCTSHQTEALKFFCKQCETTICPGCKTFLHEGHNIEMVENASRQMRSDLKQIVEGIDGDLKTVGDITRGHENDKTRVAIFKQNAIDSIREQAQEMKNKIDIMSKCLERDICKEFRGFEDDIEKDLSQWGPKQQSLTDLKTSVMQLIEVEIDHDVISNYSAMLRKYEENSEKAVQSWLYVDRPLQKLDNLYKKGEISDVALNSMLGSVTGPTNTYDPEEIMQAEKSSSFIPTLAKRFRLRFRRPVSHK